MKYCWIISLILIALNSQAQDFAGSQFWLARGFHNPGTIGLLDADYRAIALHRNQWRSVSSPFKTSVAVGEVKLFKRSNGHMGTGVTVIQDKAGTANLGVFQATGAAAYHLSADKDYFSAGVAIGYRQRSINLDDLMWDSQFNGVGADPTISSGEQFGNQKSAGIDVSSGMHWQHRRNLNYDIGLAIHHYGQMNGFLTDGNDELQARYVGTFSWYDDFGPVSVIYDAFYTQQGGTNQMVFGGRGKYRVGSDSRYTSARTSSAIEAGIHYRWADAIIAMIGYEYKRMFEAFVAYDFTTSQLQSIERMQGGWEIGLRYSGVYRDSRMKIR